MVTVIMPKDNQLMSVKGSTPKYSMIWSSSQARQDCTSDCTEVYLPMSLVARDMAICWVSVEYTSSRAVLNPDHIERFS